jgi:hypothetical protein
MLSLQVPLRVYKLAELLLKDCVLMELGNGIDEKFP